MQQQYSTSAPASPPSSLAKICHQQQRHRRVRETVCTRVATLLGTLLLLFVVALPKDLCRWLRLRRKCIQGQTVVITGGSSGIGQRLAEQLANPEKIGAKVAIIDNNLEAAERVVDGIRKHGGCAHAWQCDIADAGAMRQCAAQIHEHFGGVDILVCNAAILHFGYTMELRDEDIQRAMDVNVLGTINTIRAFLPEMEAAQGRRAQIVAISSIAGFFGETFGMAYCPTKFAVRGAMECLRMELYDRGLTNRIVCTTICPFFVRTPMILSKGIRPVSRWIPFMSVERCTNLIVDAILKEKVLAFMPSWIGLLTTINNLLSLNMQRVARDFINCRYEKPDVPPPPTINGTILGNGQKNCRGVLAKCAITAESGTKEINNNNNVVLPPPQPTITSASAASRHSSLRRFKQHYQMRDHFEFAGIFWWLLIPSALLINFLVFYSPDEFNLPWLSFGQFLYRLGTQHPVLTLWLNIFALMAHIFEAIFALYLTDELHLSHKSSLIWFLQTFALGYPSLRPLLKMWRKEQ